MIHLFSLKIMNLGMQSCLFFSSRDFFYLVKNNCKSRINCYHFSSFEENDFFFLFERGGLDSTLWKVNTLWVEQVNVLRFHCWRLGPLSYISTLTDFSQSLTTPVPRISTSDLVLFLCPLSLSSFLPLCLLSPWL